MKKINYDKNNFIERHEFSYCLKKLKKNMQPYKIIKLSMSSNDTKLNISHSQATDNYHVFKLFN